MGLHERHQVDATERIQKVRGRARPWRSILALLVALGGAVAAEASRVNGLTRLQSASQAHRLVYICGLGAFLILGLAATIGLSARVQSTSQTLIGQAHAGVLRYALAFIGVFAVVTASLAIARIDVKELLVSGAVLGVILGIAAQQSLANLFAGLVLLFAHPFRVGSRVRFKAGSLGGQMDGLVTNVGLTYVRVETDDGPALLPNVLVLGAIVLAMPEQPEHATPGANYTSGTAVNRAASDGNATSRAAANRGTAAV
jgi:small-conductance mechanosensitive channel